MKSKGLHFYSLVNNGNITIIDHGLLIIYKSSLINGQYVVCRNLIKQVYQAIRELHLHSCYVLTFRSILLNLF